jgi:DNA-binding transcriptional ArsR family regulator
MRKRDSAAITEADLDQLTTTFRLLSDKTRLNILMLLTQGERNVSTLCKELSLPQPTVSHHLGLLRMNNIIANRRSGKQVFYGLTDGMSHEQHVLHVAVERFAILVVQRQQQPSSASSN